MGTRHAARRFVRHFSAYPSNSSAFGGAPELPRRRVVVTGLGIVCPLGVGVDSVWSELVAGKTAIRRLREEDLPEAHRSALAQLPCQVAGILPKDQLLSSIYLPDTDVRRLSPFMTYAMTAAAEALADSQWYPETEDQRLRTGVAIGAGMSSPAEIAEAGSQIISGKLRKVAPYFIPRILNNMAAGAVAIRYKLLGPNHSVSTACATGVHAVGDAFRMVQRGDADVMIAGAAEACIDAVSLGGFTRLKALSTSYNDTPEKASRPFDKGRDGFVMGEGGAVLILEELHHAAARGAKVYAEVRGYGMSADGHHITQPHPEGWGAAWAMRRALQGSGVFAQHMQYINAHATSTPLGDEIEQQAILKVFGEEAVENIAVSSTKGAVGHLLGAAGAVESLFTVLALHHGVAPPTVNLEEPDPLLLPKLVGPQAVPLPPGPRAALCNSFGFGGTNAAVLFTSPPATIW